MEPRILLRLYITGHTPRSERALTNLRRICEERMPEQYRLEIVDVLEAPQLADEDWIIATPTLIRLSPLPNRRILGDLSDTAKVLLGLGLDDFTVAETI